MSDRANIVVGAWLVVGLALLCSPTIVRAQTPGTTYTVSGRVRCVDQQGNPCDVTGITITLSGQVLGSTTTRRTGVYSFLNLPTGMSITITPSKAGVNFTPSSRTVIVSNQTISALDFVVTPPNGVAYKVFGVNFSAFMDGQSPADTVVSAAQVQARLSLIAPYTQWIRLFGSRLGLENAGRIAHSMGLKVACGAWIDTNTTTNELELTSLTTMAKNGDCDLAIVGGEVLFRGDLSEAQLLAYLTRFKQQVPGVPVSTADTDGTLLAHPGVIQAVDFLTVNAYSYWSQTPIEKAVASIHGTYQTMVAAAGGKLVIIAETGWPSCGTPLGAAVPSPDNASAYFLNFVTWTRAYGVPYFYFSAFDETWKAATAEGPQGACWGVFHSDGTMKTGMQDVFDGKMVTPNWLNPALPRRKKR